MLKRPNFAVYDPNGSIKELYCKICGTQIADTQPRPLGPRFSRFSNYAEMKLRLTNGGYHILNGCRTCLVPTMSKKMMNDVFRADITEAGIHYDPDVKAKEIVGIDYSGQGMV